MIINKTEINNVTIAVIPAEAGIKKHDGENGFLPGRK